MSAATADGPRVFGSADALEKAVGTVLGTSGWLDVGQPRIDAFADATEDHQWIHVDTERAAGGPFGTTVAHGFLTLALLPRLVPEVYRVENARAGINYGLERVRFPAPLPSGERVRATVELLAAARVPGGLQLTTRVTVDAEGGTRPVCVAEWITRVLFGEDGGAAA